ncbi:MAG: oxidoreductase [Chloroflexota bacterium]|nr:oxidoreductase [Chloroflexota bacterium]
MNRKTMYFTAPRQVEVREEPLPAPGADEVLVETTCSAISAGTEMLIYQGHFPRELEADPAIASLRGGFKYPLAYGYACVGTVRKVGRNTDPEWLDRPVFAFQPHTSHFVCKPDSLLAVPEILSHECAAFLPNMETAVNLVQDAVPIYGERVLVFGQGVIGLLTASLLKEFPLEALVTVDCLERRRIASPVTPGCCLNSDAANFHAETRDRLHGQADLTFELSGNPAALNDAIELTAFSGRIVIGSWYGEKSAEIDLGGAFHRSRIKLISSQVSTIAPELSGRWDKERRFDVAWSALEKVRPEKWITHRFRLDEAREAYRLLDTHPEETIQILFSYP